MSYHCSHLDRDEAHVSPCSSKAEIVYVDVQGIRYGWCAEHIAEGIIASRWHDWRLDMPTVEESAA